MQSVNKKNTISLAIVDDNSDYRDALMYYFNQLEDIDVLFEAGNGLELMENLKTAHPQVVLLDMEMPGMNGMDALRQLRDQYPSVKFIMLTMYLEEALIKSFLHLGANSYLNKSATPQEIYTAIKACCTTDFYMNHWISDVLLKGVKKFAK